MSITAPALEMIRKYGIKSILNTPCGFTDGDDCGKVRDYGVEKTLGVNLIDYNKPGHVVGDLCVWRPPHAFDAAYVNCFFCTSNDSRVGGHAEAVRNIASWPIKYIVLFDTLGRFDWHPHLIQFGWEMIEHQDVLSSHVEVWKRAN